MDTQIFYPVIALALQTAIIVFYLGSRRFRAVKRGEASADYFRTFTSEPPRDTLAVQAERNVKNLFEAPVLFYVVCLAAFQAGAVDPWLVGLAWAYVASRAGHSLIHLTSNKLRHRFRVFILSWLVLIAIWAKFTSSLL